MKKKLIMGNWKMHGTLSSIKPLLDELIDKVTPTPQAECVVFPPAIYLPYIQQRLEGTMLRWGAQNVYPKDAGAFTGEISGPMLCDFRCIYVLVGHSERRHGLHENENFITEKFHHAKDHGMIPVLCVGETLEQREKGLTKEVISRQIKAVYQRKQAFSSHSVIAYEPVWAIGTGHTATPEEAQEMHAYIKEEIKQLGQDNATDIPVIYGGSVNEKNARALFSMPDIDGGLIGGASLNADQFVEIIKCIN